MFQSKDLIGGFVQTLKKRQTNSGTELETKSKRAKSSIDI